MRASYAIAVFALLVAGRAGAQGAVSGPCETARPDNTIRLSKRATSGSVSGVVATYLGDSCDLFVIEVAVPGGVTVTIRAGASTFPGSVLNAQRFWVPVEACDTWRQVTRLYRKDGGRLTLLSDQRAQGEAAAEGCVMDLPVFVQRAESNQGYRVLVTTSWKGRVLGPRVGAEISFSTLPAQ
jgi:hypothetical protein